jgi:hypothetical protein
METLAPGTRVLFEIENDAWQATGKATRCPACRDQRMKKQARDFVLDRLAQELAHIAAIAHASKRDGTSTGGAPSK